MKYLFNAKTKLINVNGIVGTEYLMYRGVLPKNIDESKYLRVYKMGDGSGIENIIKDIFTKYPAFETCEVIYQSKEYTVLSYSSDIGNERLVLDTKHFKGLVKVTKTNSFIVNYGGFHATYTYPVQFIDSVGNVQAVLMPIHRDADDVIAQSL